MKKFNWFSNLLFIVALLCFLSACSSSLAKPTGLEDVENEPFTEEQIELEELAENDEEQSTKTEENEKEKISKHISENEDLKEESNQVDKSTRASKKESSSATSGSTSIKVSSNSGTKQTEKLNTEKSKQQTKQESTKGKTTEKTKQAAKESSAANTITSKEETKTTPKQQPKNMVTISIVISSGEIPLSPTEIKIKEGDTVLDALIAVTKQRGIQMDYRGGQGASAYVEGIANVYEFDRGQGSGWMYRVNGIFPDRSAGTVPLEDGDRVEWLYTTNLGKDLGADLKQFRR